MTQTARKNYKRIRLAKFLEAALAAHYGEPVTVKPEDFGLPYGAWRTNVMLDVERWDVEFHLVRLPKVGGRVGSYDTLSECAANGVTLTHDSRNCVSGWFLDAHAKPK